MAKVYDVVAKTGTYTQNGEEKARWLNVGAVIETKNGLALLLEKWFTPAGVVDDKGGDSVLLNLMPADRDKGSSPSPRTSGGQRSSGHRSRPAAQEDDFEDEIPFS